MSTPRLLKRSTIVRRYHKIFQSGFDNIFLVFISVKNSIYRVRFRSISNPLDSGIQSDYVLSWLIIPIMCTTHGFPNLIKNIQLSNDIIIFSNKNNLIFLFKLLIKIVIVSSIIELKCIICINRSKRRLVKKNHC